MLRLCVFSSRAGLAPERTYSAIEIPLQEQYYRHHYSLFTIALQAAALQISRSLQRSPKRLQRLWARSLQATLQVPRFCTTASEEISHYRRHSLVLQLRACTVPVARYSTVGKCSDFVPKENREYKVQMTTRRKENRNKGIQKK